MTTPAAPDMFDTDTRSPESSPTLHPDTLPELPPSIARTQTMTHPDYTDTPPADATTYHAVIKVIGVGGGGGNAVAHMIASGVEGVQFIAANTDAQALATTGAGLQLQLGIEVTKGLGAGMNIEEGHQAALESRESIRDALSGADMVFIAAGMGGGTGTGAAPVVAQLAKELGILTVAVVTKPFSFEGPKKMRVALEGVEELARHCDSLITIPNEKLLSVLGRNITKPQAFQAANDVLLGAVRGISDLIVRPSEENIDFADVRAVMNEMGLAMIGTGRASGEDRAQAAIEQAIHNPLLDDVNLSGASGVLVNITSGAEITMAEFAEIGRVVEHFASEDANLKYGTVTDPGMGDELQVTVVVTGLNRAVPRQSGRGGQYGGSDELARARSTSRQGGGYPAAGVAEQRGASARAPQIQLVRSQGLRDGTTGMLIDDYPEPQPGLSAQSIISHLHGRTESAESEPRTTHLGDAPYLDIPAFLRRQAD